MKERPILFSSSMVRAILASTKTQTRRVVKPQPLQRPGMNCTRTVFFDRKGRERLDTVLGPNSLAESLCPYGAPGDRLWVREAWRVGSKHDAIKPSAIPSRSCSVLYAAGGSASNTSDGWLIDNNWPDDAQVSWAGRLRPSIHMPRWASRITLEITGVRVERLQDISEADAVAEGSREPSLVPLIGACWSERDAYAKLWRSIHGAGSWDANPWVWVIEFKRI